MLQVNATPCRALILLHTHEETAMNKRILTLGATLALLISPVWAQDTDAIVDDGSPSQRPVFAFLHSALLDVY